MIAHGGAGGAWPFNDASDGESGGMGLVLRDAAVHPVPLVLACPGARSTVGVPANGIPVDTGRHAVLDGAADGRAAADALEKAFRAGYGKCEAEQRASFDAMAESIRRAALEQGMAEGRRQGLEEGREAARVAADRDARSAQEFMALRLARLDQLLAALSEEMQRRLASAEEEMVALCHAVVCRILGEQLVTRQGVAHCVRQAIQEAGGGAGLRGSGQGQIALHVHPRDLAGLESDEEFASWMRQHAWKPNAVQWVPDERVGAGGCIIRSPEGSLDARLETQMAGLRQVLLQAQPGDADRAAASPPSSGEPVPPEAP